LEVHLGCRQAQPGRFAVGLLDKTKEKAIEFTQAQGGALADVGIAKVREVLGLFNEALPLLKQAGCSPSGVDVDVGLPPKVVANFVTNDVSEEAIARITAENSDKKLACAILKALQQGARLQRAIEIGRMRRVAPPTSSPSRKRPARCWATNGATAGHRRKGDVKARASRKVGCLQTRGPDSSASTESPDAVVTDEVC
jgi:hypothetical protein